MRDVQEYAKLHTERYAVQVYGLRSRVRVLQSVRIREAHQVGGSLGSLSIVYCGAFSVACSLLALLLSSIELQRCKNTELWIIACSRIRTAHFRILSQRVAHK
jgi:hypothetical protein